jgi:catechol 2,3-dioxygenase
MNNTTDQTTAPAVSIDSATAIGQVSLTVADLARSLTFYTEALGFSVLERDASTVTLGAAGAPLLLLTEHSGAKPWPRDTPDGYTGLYHFAILMPTRADLGLWLRHWLDLGFPLPGQGDHLVSEALYLSDPDGNGIEIYQDRPRDQWRYANGQIKMATDPVDIRGVLAEGVRSGRAWSGLPAETTVGHIHLQVGDIRQAADFYHGVLGFDIMAHMPTALFISAGGYHHHIGLNIWHSAGASAAPEGIAGLRHFTITLPNQEARAAVVGRIAAANIAYTEADDVVVQDPWRNTIRLRV